MAHNVTRMVWQKPIIWWTNDGEKDRVSVCVYVRVRERERTYTSKRPVRNTISVHSEAERAPRVDSGVMCCSGPTVDTIVSWWPCITFGFPDARLRPSAPCLRIHRHIENHTMIQQHNQQHMAWDFQWATAIVSSTLWPITSREGVCYMDELSSVNHSLASKCVTYLRQYITQLILNLFYSIRGCYCKTSQTSFSTNLYIPSIRDGQYFNQMYSKYVLHFWKVFCTFYFAGWKKQMEFVIRYFEILYFMY